MSAHGGSNSWNLSPSALTSPGWEVGPNRPIKRPRSPAKQKAARGRCGPPAAGPARRSSSGPHFACGAGAPPEVPGGGTTLGSPVLGAGFSMVGSTSFGWMTPFDRFSFSLRFSPGAELSGAAGVGSGLPGAWANTEPATMVTPATNRQGREPIFIMHPLNWLMCGPFPGAGDVRSVPWGRDCDPSGQSLPARILRRVAAPLSRHSTVRLMVRCLASFEDAHAAQPFELERHPVVGPGLVHRVAAELQKTFGVVAHSETLLAPAQRARQAGR